MGPMRAPVSNTNTATNQRCIRAPEKPQITSFENSALCSLVTAADDVTSLGQGVH